jgi:hypothetical protein
MKRSMVRVAAPSRSGFLVIDPGAEVDRMAQAYFGCRDGRAALAATPGWPLGPKIGRAR